MFMPRRYIRSRIWRVFTQSMAGFLGLSALIFFCGTLFNANCKPADGFLPNIGGGSPVLIYNQPEDRVLRYKQEVIASVGIHSHNRALQFMESSKRGRDSIENVELDNGDGVKQARTKDNSDIVPDFVKVRERMSPDLSASPFFLDEVEDVETRQSRTTGKDPGSHASKYRHGEKQDNSSQLIENKESQLLDSSGHFPHIHNSQRKNSWKKHRSRNSSEVAERRLPKAIVIGVKKAGTRALLEFLRIHPNIEGTGPEPHFFDRNYEKGFEWYRQLMPKTFKDQITIEKTPGYFVTKEAPERIFDMDPHIKLLLVVRDPVTRAISDYCQAASKHPVKPFEDMALLDGKRGLINTSWSAIKIGVYVKHLENWLKLFPLEQIHLVDGQKLIEEPARELAKVEQFLNLPSFINDSHFFLRGYKGTFPCLYKMGRMHCLDNKSKGRDHPVVRQEVLRRLRDFYRPFNAKFYQLVGRSFKWS